MSKDFGKIFSRREFSQIKGVNNRSIILLSIILLLTFLALGHVLGGFEKLKLSMDNPYTNWVNIGDTYLTKKAGGNDSLLINAEELKDKFDILSIKPYQRHYFNVVLPDLSSLQRFELRNVAFDDPLYEVITDDKNVIKSFPIKSENCTIVITAKMLDKLNIELTSNNLKLAIVNDTDPSVNLVFDVKCVVKELPNDVDIIVSDLLLGLYHNPAESGFYDTNSSRKISFLAPIDFDMNSIISVDEDIRGVEKFEDYELYGSKFQLVNCFMQEQISFTERLRLQKKVGDRFGILPYQEFQCQNKEYSFDKDYYSYHFRTLDNIREFRNYANRFEVNVPIYQVESKDNFVIVSKIAWTFILLLVIFSSFSVLLFINNILKNHLEKIKPNLGTLKAFGLSEKEVSTQYMGIAIKFYLWASAIAILILLFYFYLGKILFGEKFLFKLWDPIFVGLWMVVLLFIYYFFNKMIRNILFKGPGDLIYNR